MNSLIQSHILPKDVEKVIKYNCKKREEKGDKTALQSQVLNFTEPLRLISPACCSPSLLPLSSRLLLGYAKSKVMLFR